MCDYTEDIWINDPSILINNYDFIPNSKKTKEQNLNSIVRLSVILGTVLFLYYSDIKYLLFCIILWFYVVLHSCILFYIKCL